MNRQDFEIEDHVLIKYHGHDKNVIIPDDVTVIGQLAFAANHTLRSVVIPKSVVNIEMYAFAWCPVLTCVKFPEGSVSIGDCAFRACEMLRTLILPEEVVQIGWKAFDACNCLEIVGIPEGEIKVQSSDGVMTDNKIKLICMKNYTMKIKYDVKYPILFQLYECNADPEHLPEYLRKNFRTVFCWMIEKEDLKNIHKILETERFVSERNIDKFIQYAISHRKIQAQLLLTDYKYQHFDFRETGENLKL